MPTLVFRRAKAAVVESGERQMAPKPVGGGVELDIDIDIRVGERKPAPGEDEEQKLLVEIERLIRRLEEVRKKAK